MEKRDPLMDEVLSQIFRLILAIIAVLVLMPLLWIISTPFILIGSLLVRGHFTQNVARGYKAVTRIWFDWGILAVP